MLRMTNKRSALTALCLPLLLLTACQPAADAGRDPDAAGFPTPYRPVSQISGTQYSTEAARDAAGEADAIMNRAGIIAGMSVADIGAGNGYYTVRLADRVGTKGRVLAQDIDAQAIAALAGRVQRESLDNVSVITGKSADPRLPEASFERIFMVHMYHEVREPYAFLWRIWPALKKGGELIIVDRDRPTDQHGISPELLFCELKQAGFELIEFSDQPELGGYFARFRRAKIYPAANEMRSCGDTN